MGNELKQARIDASKDNLSEIKWKLTALYFKKRNGRAVIMPVFQDQATSCDSSLNDLNFFLKDGDAQDDKLQVWNSGNDKTYDSVASTFLNSSGVTKLSLRDLESDSRKEENIPTNKVIRSRKSSVGNLVSIFEQSQVFENPKKPEITDRNKPAIPRRPWQASYHSGPSKPVKQSNPIFQLKPIQSQKPLKFEEKRADESTDIDSFFPAHTSTPRRPSISRKSIS